MALFRILGSRIVIQSQVIVPVSILNRNISDSTDLKGILANKIIEHQKRVKKFREEYGDKVIGEITVSQVNFISFFFFSLSNNKIIIFLALRTIFVLIKFNYIE
ncbi:probable citrate synthase 2, mitochondrial, partial [Centruroides sculpturatus]|uniref:probable citrate synthase 2, mitochondrial n=1 Tax=Centruroides sculpturatus TaxID=218467 RepID=UPI000C6D8AB4